MSVFSCFDIFDGKCSYLLLRSVSVTIVSNRKWITMLPFTMITSYVHLDQAFCTEGYVAIETWSKGMSIEGLMQHFLFECSRKSKNHHWGHFWRLARPKTSVVTYFVLADLLRYVFYSVGCIIWHRCNNGPSYKFDICTGINKEIKIKFMDNFWHTTDSRTLLFERPPQKTCSHLWPIAPSTM